jgi:transcriptional regulator with XRE-family HTH domain
LLKEERKKAGLTQAALAKELRRPQSYVSKYERGIAGWT